MKKLKHRCRTLMALCWYMTEPGLGPTNPHSGLPRWLSGKKKNPPANAGYEGHLGSIPGSGRCSKAGNGNLLHILPGKSPWTEEHGGLQSMGSQSWTWLSNLSTCAHTRVNLERHPYPLHSISVSHGYRHTWMCLCPHLTPWTHLCLCLHMCSNSQEHALALEQIT